MNQKQPGRMSGLQICLILAGSVLILIGGCQQPGQPRPRLGAFFGSPSGIDFPDPARLGKHHFAVGSGEKCGMVYTCRGGFIDIGHVREAADRTAYLTGLLSKSLRREQTEVFFHMIEPSRYRVTITYPPGWHRLSDQKKNRIARLTAVQLASSFAHTSLVWHEILTWFGFASTGLFPETISSFSWEDTYSDLVGITLAARVLQGNQPYDQALTSRLNDFLKKLEVQPSQVARQAAHEIEGKWFSGGFYFFVEMKKRNFDTGLGYHPVTPWLVPGICPDAQPHPLPAPILTSPTAFGFEADLEIYPVELEKERIYQILNLDRDQPIRPSLHFPALMEAIRRQAQDRHTTNVGNPGFEPSIL